MSTPLDVLIIGAGISGIGMACHLQRDSPGSRFAIIDRRSRIGGTWDLFRYPGVRSDSDMFTFGYSFRPWHAFKVLADGASIRSYLTDTAREYDVERHIRFNRKVLRAEFSTATSLWTVTVLDEASGREERIQGRVLVNCTGYYNYDRGHDPDFPGQEAFKGQRIHPQFWPENLDYAGKRVVVIGSGATAMTVVPAMAESAAKVTMVQRSPTYVFSIPGTDKIAKAMTRVMPKKWAFALTRARNLALLRLMYFGSLRYPEMAKKLYIGSVRKALGEQADMRNWTPRYKPWDERLCAVPDGDLFQAIKRGRAEVITAGIERFTEGGLKLDDGREIPADIIVTATGLDVRVFGNITVAVDGQTVDPAQRLTYKATLLEGLPNCAWIVGYINAPWTLKADIAARYICRLVNHLKASGSSRFVAVAPPGEIADDNIFGGLKSNYVKRAASTLPRQGRSGPWRVEHDYRRDKPILLEAPVDDGVLQFVPASAASGDTATAARTAAAA